MLIDELPADELAKSLRGSPTPVSVPPTDYCIVHYTNLFKTDLVCISQTGMYAYFVITLLAILILHITLKR